MRSALMNKQSGAAILTAMLVVTLAAMIVSTLYARQNVTIRSIENRLNLSQTRWIERAASDWAKVILRADKRTAGNTDHRGEPWATKVERTALDETITAGGNIDSVQGRATLEGGMEDAQSFFNLSNLLKDGKLDELELETLKRLLQYLNLPDELASAVGKYMLEKAPKDLQGKVLASDQLAFKRAADLIAIPGFDQRIIQLLADHVVILPKRTAINVNTATPEVLAAALTGMGVVFDLPRGRATVEMAIQKPFSSIDDFRSRTNVPEVLPPSRWDVKSQYFLVKGVVRYDRIVSRSATLLDRSGSSVEVVWQDRY
jgi:general secretion pathway protein K